MQVKVYESITNRTLKLRYKPLSDIFDDSATQLREANLEQANLTGCYCDRLTDVTGINVKRAILDDTILLLAYTLNDKGEKLFGKEGMAHLLPKEHSAITTIAEANEYLTDVLEKKEKEKDWQPLQELSTHLQWVVRSTLYTILHIPTHKTAMESSEQRECFQGIVAKLIEHFPEVKKATEDFQAVINPPQGSLPLDEYIIEKYKDNTALKIQAEIKEAKIEIEKSCNTLLQKKEALKEKKREATLSSSPGKSSEIIINEITFRFQQLGTSVHKLNDRQNTLTEYYSPPVPSVKDPIPPKVQEIITQYISERALNNDILEQLPEESFLR